ncbi:MAG: alpha/beta fold hydrolase [Chloroflexaceae bacterium]|nr:alpha/beta fold hydrolase [Chloroflexaceae bacterium]
MVEVHDRAIRESEVGLVVEGQVLSLFYRVAGAGPPLLLLHGLGDSAQAWEWVLPELARSHTVYALDLPGFGMSNRPEVPYSPDFLTTVVAAFLDALQITHVGLIGNSLGGLLALQLALAEPTRVSAIVLIDSAGLGQSVALPLRLLTLPGVGELVIAWNRTAPGAWQWAFGQGLQLFSMPWRVPWPWLSQLYCMARSPGYLEATVATARGAMTLFGQRPEAILREQLPSIHVPTLVIWGEYDRVLPLRHAHESVARLPQGQLAIIPGAGHLPHVECPAAVAAEIKRFLTVHSANQASA